MSKAEDFGKIVAASNAILQLACAGADGVAEEFESRSNEAKTSRHSPAELSSGSARANWGNVKYSIPLSHWLTARRSTNGAGSSLNAQYKFGAPGSPVHSRTRHRSSSLIPTSINP